MSRSPRSLRWAMLVAVLAVMALGSVLLLLLALSTTGLVAERHFAWLFWVNLGAALLLALVIAAALLRLAARVRRRKFGSRLLVKLAGVLALVAVLPGALVYGVSYQFVGRTIDEWFDTRLAGALDAGLALGRGSLRAAQSELTAKADRMAQRLATTVEQLPQRDASASPATLALALERQRAEAGVEQATLLMPDGRVLAQARTFGSPDDPAGRSPIALLRKASSTGSVSQVEGLDDDDEDGLPDAGTTGPRALVRALVRLPLSRAELDPSSAPVVMLLQPLPRDQVQQSLAIQQAYRDYQQRALSHDTLRRMVLAALTLALILAVFVSVLLAAMLGNQIVRPLLLVADGVRQVAEGDLSPKPVFASRDELGGLTRSFADMTSQLSEARQQVDRGVAQLEGARTRLQTILDSLSAGVLVLDAHGRLTAVNPGATRILRQPLSAWLGRPLAEVPMLGDFAAAVVRRMEAHLQSPEPGERDHWQDDFVLPLSDQLSLNLLVRGAQLPGDERLVVFDDITEIVSAQRSQAWSEVARRVAHEIKNPLTPIQLSAERLEHKLAAKLQEPDLTMLRRSVATIVAQVQAMKTLVDTFRDYARLPVAQLAPVDLVALVREVLALYGAAQDAGRLRVEIEPGLPWIMGDATQLRQVVHNLVQNAIDAIDAMDAPPAPPQVEVAVLGVPDDAGSVRELRLVVRDRGPGFDERVLKRPFEPYVTTKAKGTGLGLAVVKKIADEHGARVRLANRDDGPGAQVSLSFSRLQSTASPLGADDGNDRSAGPVVHAGAGATGTIPAA